MYYSKRGLKIFLSEFFNQKPLQMLLSAHEPCTNAITKSRTQRTASPLICKMWNKTGKKKVSINWILEQLEIRLLEVTTGVSQVSVRRNNPPLAHKLNMIVPLLCWKLHPDWNFWNLCLAFESIRYLIRGCIEPLPRALASKHDLDLATGRVIQLWSMIVNKAPWTDWQASLHVPSTSRTSPTKTRVLAYWTGPHLFKEA